MQEMELAAAQAITCNAHPLQADQYPIVDVARIVPPSASISSVSVIVGTSLHGAT
jgi:hypothetical protein